MKNYPVEFITILGGETIAYRKAGRGPALVLVHGNMSSSVHWQTTMEKLEGTYTVYAPDLRGFGDSTYNNRFDSLHELAVDVEQFIDGLGIGEFLLVGWSTGGGVALEIAADWPGRVKKVVALESVPPTGYPIFKKDAQGQPVLTQLLKTKEEIEADPVQVQPVLQAYAAGNKDVMRAIWNAVIYNQHQPAPEEYEAYLDAMMKQRNLVDVDYALLTFNMTDKATGSAPGSGRLAQVACPVVVLHGEKDMVVPFEWGRQTLALLGSRGSMVSFPNSGHSPITDNLDEFTGVLLEALR